MPDLLEARVADEFAPVRVVVKNPEAFAAPALTVVSPGIRGEQHATRAQRLAQLAEDPREFLARYVEELGVGEDAVEIIRRQLQ